MDYKIVFNKDFTAATVYVMKVYNCDPTIIWDYFTKADLLDKWWAPKPWKCETLSLDFREDGSWKYCMVGPENERHYAGANYEEITPNRSFSCADFFTDETGNMNTEFPSVNWLFGFTGVEEGTKLTVNIHFKSEQDLRTILDMGFEEGFKMGLQQLEEIITKKD